MHQEPVERVAVITLRKTRTESRKKVVWTEDTVDNEHMNKKKSKCCCIYEKPKKFGESDSEDSDDECEHCFGHVENKHGKHKHQHQHTADCPQHATHSGTLTITEETTPMAESTATITLQPSEATPTLEPSEVKPTLQPSEATPAPAPPDKQDQ